MFVLNAKTVTMPTIPQNLILLITYFHKLNSTDPGLTLNIDVFF